MRLTTDVDDIKLNGSAWDHALITSGLRSARALAKAAHLSASTVYGARAGRVPSLETRRRIARALGVGVDVLWNRVQNLPARSLVK